LSRSHCDQLRSMTELETLKSLWALQKHPHPLTLYHPTRLVMGGRPHLGIIRLNPYLLHYTTRQVGPIAHLIGSSSVYSSPAPSPQWLAMWVVLAWCRMRNHVLGLSASCASVLDCRLSERFYGACITTGTCFETGPRHHISSNLQYG
jgi:hypothetical protein